MKHKLLNNKELLRKKHFMAFEQLIKDIDIIKKELTKKLTSTQVSDMNSLIISC